MVSWIALAISTFGLIVNIIVNRDKLASFFDDVAKRRQNRIELKKAKAVIDGFANPKPVRKQKDSKTPKAVLNTLIITSILLAIISSSIMSLLEVVGSVTWNEFISLGTGIYIAVALIPVLLSIFVFFKGGLRERFAMFGATIFATVMYGFAWSGLTAVFISRFAQPLDAGVIAGFVVTTYAAYRTRSYGLV